MTWPPLNSRHSGVGSWWRGKKDTRDAQKGIVFVCGVRVVSGEIAGEESKWTFRKSAADDYVVDGVVSVQHGKVPLRLRLSSRDVGAGKRPSHSLIQVIDVDSGAHLEVSLPSGELIRFGIEGL